MPTEERVAAFPAATNSCSASTCSRPARATPRCSAACSPSKLGIDREPRSSTGTATRRLALPALPRSARARRCAPATPSCTTADVMLAKGKKVAATLLEASEAGHSISATAHSKWSAPTARSPCSRPRARAKELGRDARQQGEGRHAADVPQRLSHRRGRDRSRHRQCRSRHLHGGGRLRQSCSTRRSSRARCRARWPTASARR